MTTHSFHPDIHTFGLQSGCSRCAEHAEHPEGLDSEILARLRDGDVHTQLDIVAAVNLALLDRDRA